jgi:hypothetical protein
VSSKDTFVSTVVCCELTANAGDPEGGITCGSDGFYHLWNSPTSPVAYFTGGHVTYTAPWGWGTAVRSAAGTVTVSFSGARGLAGDCVTPLWQVTCSGTTTLY